MKATELLKAQHDETKRLFKAIESGKGDAVDQCEELADMLAAHMVIEQEIFYPAVLAADENLVLEGYEEHAVARFALKRLMKIDDEDQTFQAKVKTLKEIIEHHVEEEEEEMFPKAETALGERSEELCERMKMLFEKTVEDGYEQTVGPGGTAVTSASARAVANHASS